MAILHEFDYHRPETVSAAVKLLTKFKHPMLLAGGTDLINELKAEVIHPDGVIDLKAIPELHDITFSNGVLTIGAAVTFAELIESRIIQTKFPVIAEVARTVGSTGVRNRATMIGNICSAVPCADSAPLLTAYEAHVLVRSLRSKRKIPIASWFIGNRKTAIKPGEIVTAVEIALPARNHAGCFVKLGRYSGEDLAQASVIILALPKRQYRIAFGSVGITPIRAERLEKLLNGHLPSDERIAEAKAIIPEIVKPISDIRASKEYRLHMCQVMFARGIEAAVARLNGNGSEYGSKLI